MTEPLDIGPIKARAKHRRLSEQMVWRHTYLGLDENGVERGVYSYEPENVREHRDYCDQRDDDIDALIAEVERLRRVEGGFGFCGNCGERCDYCGT